VVKEVLHTTPAATLDAAQAAARDAGAAVGTQVSPVNFLPANNPLVALRGAVASDVRGGATQAQINAEKAASQAAGAAEIEKLAPGVTPSAETGAAVDASLAEVPKLADQASNAAASDLYDAAAKQTLTEPDVENIVQSLQGAQHRANAATDVDHPMFPQFEREKSAFNKYLPQQAPESVLDALEPAPPLPPAAPFPSWNTINAMGKAKLDQGKSVLIGAKATPAQVVKADVGGILKDAAAAESMPIAGANIIGTTGRDFLSPAGIEEGAKNLSNAAVTPENVRDISSSMARADAKLGVTEPTFPLMAKEKQLVESAKAPDMGKWSRDTSGSATGSSGQQAVRANFLETEKQAFIQGGATEADAARAAEGAAKVHDVIQAIADGHTNLPTNVSIARVLADASSGVLSKVLRFMTPSFEMVRTWTAANHLDKVSFAKTMANLDKALASPDMVADLKKFAEWNWQAKLAKAGARAGVSVGARYENN
jgi:hypothetical protein